jgi:dimeric dUTPase (all-alpha-NTP-PPase superfamily)
MGTLFNEWLGNTKKLQTEAYKIDYSKFEGQSPESLNNIIEYLRWNMLAIEDELAEIRKEISWKPWQHDDPYVNREAVVKECVDVLHFVANIICAVGGTDEQLDAYYVNKMEVNRQRQLKGYSNMSGGAVFPQVTWTDVMTNSIVIGDMVRVKLHSYSGVVGEIHNGRYCEVLDIRDGDVIVSSIDGLTPSLSETHHSPNVLEKMVIA